MTDSIELKKHREYRNRMEFPIESLAYKLETLGWNGEEGHTDDVIVETATRKLGTLYALCLASGMNEALLKAVMAE